MLNVSQSFRQGIPDQASISVVGRLNSFLVERARQ